MPKDTIIGPKLNNLNFFMIGCWGENNCDERSGLRRVAEQMNKRYNIYQNYDFVISMGDNLYQDYDDDIDEELVNREFIKHGGGDINDKWDKTWNKCFGKLPIPWLVSLGNHAYDTKVDPDFFIDYQSSIVRIGNTKIDKWNLPNHYWCYKQPMTDGSQIAFIFLDTTVLVDYDQLPEQKKIDKKIKKTIYKVQGWNKQSNPKITSSQLNHCSLNRGKPSIPKDCQVNKVYQLGECLIDRNFPAIHPKNCKMTKKIKLNDGSYYYKSKPNETYTIPDNQFRWLRLKLKELNRENTSKIFIIGHHPIIANGHKSKKPIIFNKILYENLYQNIIIPYNNKNGSKIIGYFCADEHNFQHLVDKDTGFHFVVCGTGGAHSDKVVETKDLLDKYNIETLFAVGNVLGFLDVSIKKRGVNGVKIKYINNLERYEFII